MALCCEWNLVEHDWRQDTLRQVIIGGIGQQFRERAEAAVRQR